MRRFSALLLIAAALAGCSNDPVDPKLVGTWQTAIASDVGAWQLRFTTLSNGQYRTEFFGPFPLPAETGYFLADDGEWRVEKIAGGIEEGTYEFLSDDSVLFKTPAGAIVWNRVAGDGTAAASLATPGVANPAFPTVAGAPVANAFTAPAESSFPQFDAADAAGSAVAPALLTTGPFGAAMPEPAAFAPAVPNGAQAAPFGSAFTPPAGAQPAPFGAGLSAPAAGATPSAFSPPGGAAPVTSVFSPPRAPAAAFGAGNPSAFGAPTTGSTASGFTGGQAFIGTSNAAAGFGGPSTVGGAIDNVERQLESNVRELSNLPQQTVNTIERDVQRTAAQAVNEATAPVTEAADEVTRRAGERVQRFTSNTASKVRNFFTGGNRRNGRNEEAEQDDR